MNTKKISPTNPVALYWRWLAPTQTSNHDGLTMPDPKGEAKWIRISLIRLN